MTAQVGVDVEGGEGGEPTGPVWSRPVPGVVLWEGEALEVMRKAPDGSVDAVVTDPPYSLSFMGHGWDTHRTPFGFQQWCQEWAQECLRVLRPGGHLLSFGGTRTWHRLTCGIEDAGFEIRDSIAWLYGSGFPKSLDVSKAIDKAAPAMPAAQQWQGWGTALKPAFEPIVVARRPLAAGTVAANVQQWGTGAINVDGCRVPTPDGQPAWNYPNGAGGHSFSWNESVNQHGAKTGPTGRWPTNVVLDGAAADELDRQSGTLTSGKGTVRRMSGADRSGNASAAYGAESRPAGSGMVSYADSGGASRFFPVFRYQAKAPTRERVKVDGVAHPTVKPLELLRWLVRLVCQPGGRVLDPFAGSGTTGEACLLEGMQAVLIENYPDYVPLIEARLFRTVQSRGRG